MLSLLSALWLATVPLEASEQPVVRPPPPQCLFAQGRSVCGYQCKSNGTQAACARTPYGICEVLVGGVHCWDPPLAAIQHPPTRGAKPECKESRGQVACGYNCRQFNGEVACNRTPYGVCSTNFNQLKCWDPPDAVIHQYGAETPAPRCLNASEALACGYDCKATRTEVQCAATPDGVCRLDNQRFSCFDPPSLLHCDHSAPPPPRH
ncbi:hypothetical protein [Myxococcus sp. Y35]|uniref:hypothetical protein n=1 Tax=Pseudomyxococcus flavus TaxID=3115648 RepID=UPI003CECC5AC